MENKMKLAQNEEAPIQITKKALEMFKEALEEENLGDKHGIRVGCSGGGCAGLQYTLDFGESKDYDLMFDMEGLSVYIDCISLMHLEGISIDYQMGIAGTGFKFSNPYAKNTCGCGSSFN